MIKLSFLYNEVKLTNSNLLKQQGYIYYPKLNEWIFWYEKTKPEDSFNWESTGIMFGYNPNDEEYQADYYPGNDVPFNIEKF